MGSGRFFRLVRKLQVVTDRMRQLHVSGSHITDDAARRHIDIEVFRSLMNQAWQSPVSTE